MSVPPPHFTIASFEFFVLPTRTRFPFRYGIASLTEVPHLFVRTRVTHEGKSSFGLAAEGLPPKWFTKDPKTTFAQDLGEMLRVISHATKLAGQIAQQRISFFELWQELDRQQTQWAAQQRLPPLLAHLGVSLVERAVIDGLCRVLEQPLNRVLARNGLSLRLGEIYPELGNLQPADYLPAKPLVSCFLRHTIGLADALGPGDIRPEDRVVDGLPQDLESSIRAYGLRYFKLKLSGATDRDFPRLRELTRLLERETNGKFFVTLDGNENFRDFTAFREFWQHARSDPALSAFWPHVLLVEQPVHRDFALTDEAGVALAAWPDRPPLILDESDGAIGDVPRALELGYVGASHKNCKGIVKGIANACLLQKRRGEGQPGLLTGEDLCILGPVVLLQDLAMMALLGIEHVERNGHHYYRGLSMFPSEWQEAVLAAHGDIYRRHEGGFAALKIHEGKLHLGSINAAPLGIQPLVNPEIFQTQPMP